MITDEIIEQWRAEFEAFRLEDHPSPCLDRDETGGYVAINTWIAWKYWKRARQTARIELPNFHLMDDPDGEGGRGEYVMREVLEARIQKQGYQCRAKD